MIEQLVIRNYALIDNLTINFNDGFTVLSGETGAGKSIMIGALSAISGSKADSSVIRSGKDEAEVCATLDVSNNSEALAWLKEKEISCDDNFIQLRRKITANGRSSQFIQGSSVTKSELNELSSLLFDIHGQHEHQSLLSSNNQRKILDRYAGHEDKVLTLREKFLSLTEEKKRYSELNQNELDRAREMDYLEYAVNEINQAELQKGEEEELERELKVLDQFESLFNSLSSFIQNAAESKNGALAALRNGLKDLSAVSEINPDFQSFLQRAEDAFYELEDVTEQCKEYKATLQFDPDRINKCGERIQTINSLKKKFGPSIGEILKFRDEAVQKIIDLQNWESNKEELASVIKTHETEALKLASEISGTRKDKSRSLAGAITAQLVDLGMPNGVFEIRLGRKENEEGKPVCGPAGFDSIDFMISLNKGEPLKELKSVASGGEISRIMLAVKTVLSGNDQIGAMIFDEIDSGIGGVVAAAVGDKIKQIACGKQIICITHLASIAVRADNHIKVEKKVLNGRTSTQIRKIADEDKVVEIARMLAGDSDEEASLRHARELLSKYGPKNRSFIDGQG